MSKRQEILDDLKDQIQEAIKTVDFSACQSALLTDLDNLRSACADYLDEFDMVHTGRER